MSSTPEMWIAIGVVGTALFGYLTARLNQIQKAVDGPLTIAISNNAKLAQENAELKQQVAKRTGDHVDLQSAAVATEAAVKAVAIDDNRKAGKAAQ